MGHADFVQWDRGRRERGLTARLEEREDAAERPAVARVPWWRQPFFEQASRIREERMLAAGEDLRTFYIGRGVIRPEEGTTS